MEAPLQYILVAAATTAFSVGAYRAFNRSPSIAKRPPGPKGLPLLGNVLQVPGQHLATYFRSLCEEYGGLVSLNLAGFPVILIGDIKAAKDILDKRSAKFSSRPIVPYVRNHVDPTQSYWGICEAGETHLIARRLTANLMSAVRGGKTEALQEFETLLTTINLLNDGGKNWFHQVNRTSASSVLTVAFGLHCPTGDELDLKEVLHCIEEFVSLCTPSASIINVLPFLDRLPGPKPWRKRAKAYREREDALYKKLVAEAVSGKASDMNTWAAHFAKKDKPEGDQSRLMNQFTGAAIETTAVAMQSFVLACLLYPEWIPRAQQEIDSVVGSDRMPSFKDRPYLPYVESIMRETLRWRPAARFGVPHQSTADDVVEYQGQQYFIPKGSIIFAVAWAMEHDSDKFDDCDRFNPDRFLDEEGKLKSGYETSAFGFGRRVCPGAPFAERSLWIGIAMFLWTFNIKKSEQVDSKTGLPFKYDSSDAAFSGEFSNAPFEFPAVFQPRSMMHEEVARREWAECEKDLTALLPQPTEK